MNKKKINELHFDECVWFFLPPVEMLTKMASRLKVIEISGGNISRFVAVAVAFVVLFGCCFFFNLIDEMRRIQCSQRVSHLIAKLV